MADLASTTPASPTSTPNPHNTIHTTILHLPATTTPTAKPRHPNPALVTPPYWLHPPNPRIATHLRQWGALILAATFVLLMVALVPPYMAELHLAEYAYATFYIGAFTVCSDGSFAGCVRLGHWSHDCAIVNLNDPPYGDVMLADCAQFHVFRYAMLVAVLACFVAGVALMASCCGCLERWDRDNMGVMTVVSVLSVMACMCVIIALGTFTSWASNNGVADTDRHFCYNLLAASMPVSLIAAVCFVIATVVMYSQRARVVTMKGSLTQQIELGS